MSKNPQFSREAGQILSSPYFSNPPAGLTGDPLIEWFNDRQAERDALADACQGANSRDELPADLQAVWQRARDAIELALDYETLYDRLHGRDYL